MKLFDLKCYELLLKIQLKIFNYLVGGSLGIMMISWEDGVSELWGALTVNLVHLQLGKDCAFIDVNNNGEEILAWIVRNGLGTPTGRIAFNGYCAYLEYHFNMDILKKLDPEGYAEYLKRQRIA